MHTCFNKLPLKIRRANDLYMDLEPLFAADPMLLHVLIAMCPTEDYLKLFTKVPTYLSLSWISRLTKHVQTINNEDVSYFYLFVDMCAKISTQNTVVKLVLEYFASHDHCMIFCQAKNWRSWLESIATQFNKEFEAQNKLANKYRLCAYIHLYTIT